MKKETIVWQIIVIVLGVLLICTLKTYFGDKNEILAETNRANCLISINEKGLDNISSACTDIELYKLKDSSK